MSLDPNDRFYQEVFVKEIYKPVLDEICDVVIDVGALAGEFSIWIYDKAKQIYTIEPESNQFAELEENIKDFPKIKAFKLALSNINRTAPFFDGGRGGGKISVDDPDGLAKEIVKTQTLATFMKENNIDHVNILKIDIENGEEAVFCSKDFPEVADKIDYIIGEHLDGKTKDTLIVLGFKYEHYDNGSIFKR